jgi:hypothetical protein
MDQGEFYAGMGVLWVFGLIVVAVVGWHLRSQRQIEKMKIVHAERMRAMEKGVPLPEFPEFGFLDERDARRVANPRWPLGVGALLLTGGLGFCVAMLLAGRDFEELWAFGLIPMFLGAGMFLFYALTRTPSARS